MAQFEQDNNCNKPHQIFKYVIRKTINWRFREGLFKINKWKLKGKLRRSREDAGQMPGRAQESSDCDTECHGIKQRFWFSILNTMGTSWCVSCKERI